MKAISCFSLKFAKNMWECLEKMIILIKYSLICVSASHLNRYGLGTVCSGTGRWSLLYNYRCRFREGWSTERPLNSHGTFDPGTHQSLHWQIITRVRLLSNSNILYKYLWCFVLLPLSIYKYCTSHNIVLTWR